MKTILYTDGSTQNDTFTALENADDALPVGDVILPASALEAIDGITGKKGVFLTAEDSPEELELPLAELDLICIEFTTFNDGRGYSFARILRRQGFTGEIRAIGDVFKDVIFYLKRSGFDSFVLKDGADVEDIKKGLTPFSRSYQAAHTQAESKFQPGLNK